MLVDYGGLMNAVGAPDYHLSQLLIKVSRSLVVDPAS